jgi:hypothetical protein
MNPLNPKQRPVSVHWPLLMLKALRTLTEGYIMATKTKAAKRTIRVRIRASQKVHYDTIVNMTPEEWADFKRQTPRRAAESLVGGWVDTLNDVINADDIDEDDFEAVAVDAKGKALNPLDQYTGPDVEQDLEDEE